MPRIAIPIPHSSDREYAERAIPQYEQAIEQAGGEPVRIPLDETSENVTKLIASCDAVLLPGSKADVDPAKFHAPRSRHTAAADVPRNTVDELLLQDAYRQRKPILGICYGLQSLNVFRAGSLIQHIPDFLPEDLRSCVSHEAGKTVPIAHIVEVAPNSKLAEILRKYTAPTRVATDASAVQRSEASANSSRTSPAQIGENREGHGFSRAEAVARNDRVLAPEGSLLLPVNSSHHQSAGAIGQGLRIAARCPADGIIEALEGTAPDHFVLAVQWHPERSIEEDESSRAIFRALINATDLRRKQPAGELENVK
ncbi:MAG TPA: gamma-glutamyl-gamma-aminobutyrate hydrolase family protein [Candidatus Sulfotelmatobacter sp.]|nr:gamma-glutamyl-gamma-aminobutyrate hydrolase family protein [Candidatus Sulfotelmatobacter sp.]